MKVTSNEALTMFTCIFWPLLSNDLNSEAAKPRKVSTLRMNIRRERERERERERRGNTFVLLNAARVNCLQSTAEASVIIYPACGLPPPQQQNKGIAENAERTNNVRASERLVFIGDCNNICRRRRQRAVHH